MKVLFETIVQSLRSQRPAVLVSIVSSSGSTPRRAGAHMLVSQDGGTVGTIGGGAVENAARLRAVELLAAKDSDSRSYGLTKEDISNLGMVCGGRVNLHFQYLDPAGRELLALFETAAELLEHDENVWMLRRISNGGISAMGLFYRGEVRFSDGFAQSEIRPLLKGYPVLTDGEPALFVEPVARAGRVYIFGGGHVSQELVPALARVDFQCVVFEEREQFADPALFPDAKGIIVGSFENIAQKVRLQPQDYVVVMTRGHSSDRAILRQALQSEATYIGCIGSRNKVAATRQALMEEIGITEQDFARVHTPIGLEIAAETPAEIAVSIAAQMILHRAGLKLA